MDKYPFLFVVWLGTAFSPALCQLSVSTIFSDHMVLQRHQPVKIWGKGIPELKVKVKFLGRQYFTTIAKDSSWVITMKPSPYQPTPQQLTIESAAQLITLSDILIGDVWFCFGQSNMEFPLERELYFPVEKNTCGDDLLRIYPTDYPGKNIYAQIFSSKILHELAHPPFFKGAWKISDSSTLKPMSAVAYYFGSAIRKMTGIPIGLINVAVGGIPIESLLNPEVLKRKYPLKLRGSWVDNDYLPVWVRQRGIQNIPHATSAPRDSCGPFHPFKPGFVYSSGVSNFFDFPITGLIFYQGESNAQEWDRVQEYRHLVQDMVSDYRQQWKQKKLPFYFVQLSSIDTVNYLSNFWPEFRVEQQKIMAEIPHSGMAVSLDAGEQHNVHPANKKIIGERLARWALKDYYHYKIMASGPQPKMAVFRADHVIIKFKKQSGGLSTQDNLPVKGFTDVHFHPLQGTIKANIILLPVNEKPRFLFYGWQPYYQGNLINRDSLPVSTFKMRVR